MTNQMPDPDLVKFPRLPLRLQGRRASMDGPHPDGCPCPWCSIREVEHDPICLLRFDKYQQPCKECEIIRATRESIAAAIEARIEPGPEPWGGDVRNAVLEFAARIARRGGGPDA